jgi:hypothetical protein
MPCPGGPEGMRSPEFMEKMKKGPVALFTVIPAGDVNLLPSLILWFIYSIIVSVFAAYIAGEAHGRGAPYLEIFQFTGCVAFAGYSLGLLQNSIWFKRKWSATVKSVFDGLIYALVTAGTFGWLWPS